MLRTAINFFVLFCFLHIRREVQLIVARFLSYFGSVFTQTELWSLRSTFALVLSFLCKLPKSCGFDPFATFSMPWLGLLCCMCVCFYSFLSFLGLVMQPRLPSLLCSCKHGFYQTHYYAMFYPNIYTMWARMVSGRDCNGEGRTEEKTTKNQTCASVGSKGGAPGECPLPTDQNFLNFVQFMGKFGKIVCCPLPPFHG